MQSGFYRQRRTFLAAWTAMFMLAGGASAAAPLLVGYGQPFGSGGHGAGNGVYLFGHDGVFTSFIPFPGQGAWAGLASTPDGRLLGFASAQLAQLDLATQTVTPIGGPSNVNATGFDVLSTDGRGFVVPFDSNFETQQLHQLDLTTGQATPIGSPKAVQEAIEAVLGQPMGNVYNGGPFIIGLGSVGNTIYGVDLVTYSLIGLSPNDGSAFVVGALGAVGSVAHPSGQGRYFGFAGLTGVDQSNDGIFDTLYMVVNYYDPTPGVPGDTQAIGGIAQVNLSDGTWTMVGTNPGHIFYGLAAVPEPAALLLVLLGGVALRRR